ncbi:MAG: hypothetical protein AAF620_14640 [Bacteroidota bacterium]
MNDLYYEFSKIARNPEIGKLRYDRSYPFYMAPVREHFAIYKLIDSGIIIATKTISGFTRSTSLGANATCVVCVWLMMCSTIRYWPVAWPSRFVGKFP